MARLAALQLQEIVALQRLNSRQPISEMPFEPRGRLRRQRFVELCVRVRKPPRIGLGAFLVSYHARLYAQVEPTSVTPFSPPVLDRALHAVLVAYVRQLGTEGAPPRPVPDELIATAQELLEARVAVVDPAELDNLEQVFQARYDEWKRWRRIEWTQAADGEIPLIRPAGSYVTRAAARLSWSVPQSLRNVDAECRAEITTAYLNEDADV